MDRKDYKFTAQEIATIVNGKVVGNKDIVINELAKIEDAVTGSISFLSNDRYIPYLYETKASAVIVNQDFKIEKPIPITCTLIIVKDARLAFTELLNKYHQIKNNKSGIEQPSFISPSANLGNNVYVGALAYISENTVIGDNVKIHPGSFVGADCIIGKNSVLHPGVKVYSGCIIGNDCTLHAGVVIGSDGFGFAPNSENHYTKMAHAGNVILEDFVEIGANTTIDRATLGSTVIHKGVKLDNLIQVGHNAEIGENTVIAAQSGVAGSAKIGKNCLIGGQVGIIGHISIADGTKIAAQSGIGQTISEPNTVVQGSPAFAIGEYKRSYVMFRNLPKLKLIIDQLEKELNELKQITSS